MGYLKKTFDELDVLDDFLMNAIAADKEVGEAFCRELLSVLLQRRLGRIRVRTQRTLPAPTPEYRGIRMDVEVEEFADDALSQPVNVYDIEPHLQNDLNLPRHNRFYQAKIDSRHMKSGENDFSRMPDLFVITILNFDPFGYDYMMYTIENHCAEIDTLEYKDGLKFIYFYTGGTKGGSQKIKTTLQYLQHSTNGNATDDTTRMLHDYVSRVKVLPEVRQDYMTFEQYIYYQRKDAAKEATELTTKTTRIDDIFGLLEEHGEIPGNLRKTLEQTKDPDALKSYLKLAAKADSIEDFIVKAKLTLLD